MVVLIFAILGAAYAALILRLVIKIINRRENRPKAKTALMAAPLLYALSFGPMASLGRHDLIPEWLMVPFGIFYTPLIWFLNDAPKWVTAILNWYSEAWP